MNTNSFAGSGLDYVVGELERKKHVGPIEGLETRKNVGINTAPEAIRWLADDISTTLYQTLYRDLKLRGETLTQESFANYIIKAFEFAVAVRVVSVDERRLIRLQGIRPADFEYLSFFGPLLASIGRYSNNDRGYRLNPILGERLIQTLTEDGSLTLKVDAQVGNKSVSAQKENQTASQIDKKTTLKTDDQDENVAVENQVTENEARASFEDTAGFLTIPEWYTDFMVLCRTVKIFTNYALPRETEVDDEEFYKIFNDGDYIIGVDGNPRNETILTALFLQCVKLSELMGEYRVKYVVVNAMRPIFTNLALKLLHRIDS